MTDVPAGRAAPRWTEVFAVVLLAVAAHAPALHGTSFTIDDHTIVENNARLVVGSPGDLWRLVTTSYWAEEYQAERLWRPVVLASFALDRALFGPDPDAFRAVNVGLHAAASVVALLLFARLLRSRAAALTAALLFAVHPVHAEATAGIVGRAEVMGLLFPLLGMHLHLRARDPGDGAGPRSLVRWAGAALCFGLGFAAKEVALTGPFVLAVVEVALARGQAGPAAPRRWSRLLGPYAVYLLVIAAYFVARWQVLGGLVPPPEAQSIGNLPLTTRVLVAALTCRDALAAVLAPAPTAALYPFEPPTWTDAAALLALVVDAALLVAALLAVRARSSAARAFGVGALGFFMTLGPSSNLIPIGVVFAERLVYTPSLWGVLAVVAAATPLLRRDRRAWAAALTVVLTLCALRLGQNARAWSSDLGVWTSTLRRFGDEPRAHYGYAAALWKRGGAAAALPHAQRAIEEDPTNTRLAAGTRALLGRLLHELGRTGEALPLLEQARALRPDHEGALSALLEVQLDLLGATPPERRAALLEAAERTSEEATRAVPHSYMLWLYRGSILAFVDGREAEAEAAYDRAIERRPEPWEAWFNRARLRYAGGAVEGALEDYRRVSAALRAADRGEDARRVLPYAVYWEARAAQELGRPAEAEAARAWLARHRPELLERLGGADE